MQHPATAEVVLTALWRQLAVPCPPPPADPECLQRLAQRFGERAMECVAQALGGNRDALVQASAGALQALVELWAASGLLPDEIWVELHKREQLGSLLMRLNQVPGPRGRAPARRMPRRLLKPWRVHSTKLP